MQAVKFWTALSLLVLMGAWVTFGFIVTVADWIAGVIG